MEEMKMKALKKALDSEQIDYTTEYVDGEFLTIPTFNYDIEIFFDEETEKYTCRTYKIDVILFKDEEAKNERYLKSIKAVLNYIDRFYK